MKVGDYVGTKSGSIFKIIGGNEDDWDLDISFGYLETFEEEWLELYRYNDNHSFFNDKNIIKSSPNIIDLIEVGDILSFEDDTICRVMEITDNGYYLLKDYGGEQYYERKEYMSELTSIVTKQQFSQMEYKVGE